MKKKLFPVYFALLLFIIAVLPSSAAGSLPRLLDGADLLSEQDEKALLNQLNEISERQQADIVVVTVNSLDGASPMEYADDFYDYNDYGFGDEKDGILFLISMEERDWYISTTGYCITAVTDAGREYMSERFLDDLSDGEYMKSFTTFAELCDDFITQARTGEPYDVGNLPKKPFWFTGWLAISFAIAFIISLIVAEVMRGKLKTVHSQLAADSYVKKGSVHLTKQNDLFLYRHVNRRKKPENNSSGGSGGSMTHVSSSGSTHGGGGGKF